MEHLLRSANLLNKAIAHHDNAIPQSHSLGLVMGDINKRRIDPLTQLDQFSTHRITQFGVQIGKRFIHQQNLRLTDNSTTNGCALPLATGESLGLSVQVSGDIGNFGGVPYCSVNFSLGSFP